MKLPRPRRGRVSETFYLWAQRSFVFLLTLLAGWMVYELVLAEIDDGGRQLWPFLIIWVWPPTFCCRESTGFWPGSTFPATSLAEPERLMACSGIPSIWP